MLENSTSPIMKRIALAMAKLRSLNKCRSTIGNFAFHSQMIAVMMEMRRSQSVLRDPGGGKPVFPLTLVEHDLERTQPQRNQAQGRCNRRWKPFFLSFRCSVFELRRILNEALREDQRDDADGDVDGSDPLPYETLSVM